MEIEELKARYTAAGYNGVAALIAVLKDQKQILSIQLSGVVKVKYAGPISPHRSGTQGAGNDIWLGDKGKSPLQELESMLHNIQVGKNKEEWEFFDHLCAVSVVVLGGGLNVPNLFV